MTTPPKLPAKFVPTRDITIHWQEVNGINTARPTPELCWSIPYGVRAYIGMDRIAYYNATHTPLPNKQVQEAAAFMVPGTDGVICFDPNTNSPRQELEISNFCSDPNAVSGLLSFTVLDAMWPGLIIAAPSEGAWMNNARNLQIRQRIGTVRGDLQASNTHFRVHTKGAHPMRLYTPSFMPSSKEFFEFIQIARRQHCELFTYYDAPDGRDTGYYMGNRSKRFQHGYARLKVFDYTHEKIIDIVSKETAFTRATDTKFKSAVTIDADGNKQVRTLQVDRGTDILSKAQPGDTVVTASLVLASGACGKAFMVGIL